ncbi:MAG: LysM peptidoglycan-binding domain-containing protein [Halarsenatibacteraceae bacterium]
MVNNGDTLWNLARRYYDSNTDLRKVIFEIKEINNMTTSDIRPGQQIIIPLK